MASKSANKMDMSLDQIIKLQKKDKQARPVQTRGRGRGRGRGGRGGGRGGSQRVGLKVGVATGLRTGRLGVGVGRQRLAQNLVKRAMLQRRRQAIAQRKAANAANAAGNATTSQRLLQEVRRWRNTAQVLQVALQQQQQQTSPQKVRLRRPGVKNTFQNVQTTSTNSVQSRLGWRRGRRGRGGNSNVLVRRLQTNSEPTTTFGRMQSDIISREQARQQRLADAILKQTLRNIRGNSNRGVVRRQQNRGRGRGNRVVGNNVQFARNSINRRFGQSGGGALAIKTSFRGRGRGRGGRRYNASRADLRDEMIGGSGGDSDNTFRSSFASSSSRAGTTLNERFGGGSSVGFRFNNTFGGRGRGRNRRFDF